MVLFANQAIISKRFLLLPETLETQRISRDYNKLPIGTSVVQPGSRDLANRIGKLSEFVPIKFQTPGSQPENYVDTAIS